jgi:hypothetical protein
MVWQLWVIFGFLTFAQILNILIACLKAGRGAYEGSDLVVTILGLAVYAFMVVMLATAG